MKVTSVRECPELGVSHNPLIKKHLLIAGGEIAGITNFSRAVFPPGEVAPGHSHSDMTEVFYIESGSAEIVVDGALIAMPAGSCITIEPGERHELRNTGGSDMTVIYFGVLASGRRSS